MTAKYDTAFRNRLYDNKAKIWLGHAFNPNKVAHWHKEIEIIRIKKGMATITVNMDKFCCSEGDLVLCCSGDVHYLQTSDDSVIDIIIYDDSLLKPEFRQFEFKYIPNEKLLDNDIKISDIYYEIGQELKFKKRFYEYSIQSKLTKFFVDLYRSYDNKEYNIKRTPKNKDILNSYQNLINYIDVNYSIITFEEAAKKMNYTPSHFSKVFKEICGINFNEYINFLRVEKALEFLNKKNNTITYIATQCGFNNVRTFNRVFKKYTGLTPKEIPLNYSIDNGSNKDFKNDTDYLVHYDTFR